MSSWREHDYRLAPAALLVWGATAAGELGQHTVLQWVVVTVAASSLAGVGIAIRKAPGRYAAGLVVASGALAIAGALLADARLTERTSSAMAQAAHADAFVRMEGVVESRPRPLRSSPDRVVVQVRVDTVRYRGSVRPGGVSVVVLGPTVDWSGVVPGVRVAVSGVAHQPERPSSVVALVIDAGGSSLESSAPRWSVLAEHVRGQLAEAASVNDPDAAGLLVAMVDGDTSGISDIVQDEFRRSGLAHLLAVSGANVAIVIGAVLWAARACRVAFAGQIAIAGAGLTAFVLVAGPEPSVLRAAGMGVVMLIALASGRPRAAVPALCAAILVLVVSVPELATSIGFVLSVLATAAIVVVGSQWTDQWAERMPRVLAAAFAVAASAALVTLPVIVLLMPLLNVSSILANVVAAPAVPFATIFGVVAAACAPALMPLAQVCCFAGGFFTRWIAYVAHTAAQPGPWQIRLPDGLAALMVTLGTLTAVVVLAWLVRRMPLLRTALAGAVVGALVLSAPVRCAVTPWPPGDWVFAACDVGQGDAVLARAGPSAAVVLDAGPDPALLEGCLRDLAVDEVPILLLTHFHDDHVAGVPAVLGRRSAGRVVFGTYDGGAAERAVRLLAASVGSPVTEASAGWRVHAGEVSLEVLGPPHEILGTTSDQNNNSLLVRVVVQGVSMLVAGDAQVELEAAMVGCGCLRVDILKVPHHGSKNRDDAFLAETGAGIALISVGADNDYGHPAPSTISELERLGMTVRRTDRHGTIVLAVRDGVLVELPATG